MAKTKKISINALDKIIKENYTPTETFEWHGIQVVITKTISLQNMLRFVDSVSKTCFSKSDSSYMPEVKDFMIKSCILEKYTNISLPSNLEHRYEILYCTDIIDSVLKYINKYQINEILSSIDDKIKNMAQSNIEAITRQMNEIYSSFNDLEKQLSKTFSDISPEDMTKLLSIITDNNFSENNTIDSYIRYKEVDSKAD